jgi:hypothetical protein
MGIHGCDAEGWDAEGRGAKAGGTKALCAEALCAEAWGGNGIQARDIVSPVSESRPASRGDDG